MILSLSLVSFFRSESRSHRIPRRSVGRSVGRCRPRPSASHDGTPAISISAAAATAFVVVAVGPPLSPSAAATAAAATTPQSTRPSSSMTPYLPRRRQRRLHWLRLQLLLPRCRAIS